MNQQQISQLKIADTICNTIYHNQPIFYAVTHITPCYVWLAELKEIEIETKVSGSIPIFVTQYTIRIGDVDQTRQPKRIRKELLESIYFIRCGCDEYFDRRDPDEIRITNVTGHSDSFKQGDIIDYLDWWE